MLDLSVFRALQSRRQAFVSVFDGPNGKTVLRDLAKFCRASESTFHPDARISAVLEGRREVWLRIQEYLQLTDEELYELRGGPTDAG